MLVLISCGAYSTWWALVRDWAKVGLGLFIVHHSGRSEVLGILDPFLDRSRICFM